MYDLKYDTNGIPVCVVKDGLTIPFDEENIDFKEFLEWNKQQEIPIDTQSVNDKEKEKAEKKQREEDTKKELQELDIKKIRYLLEKEKGDESGKKYFDAYEAETLKLRNELKSLED